MPTPTETLRKIFRDIATAIRGKDGTTEAEDKIHPEDYATRIDAIQIGPDTSDATATASDISSGKIAYGAEGRIEGTLAEQTTINISGVAPSSLDSDGLHISADVPDASTGIVRSGAKVNVTSPASSFGTAVAEDVMAGKTFTSEAGLKVTGSLVPETGTDTSDATATANDIAGGLTAYVNGGKVSGKLMRYLSGSIFSKYLSKVEVDDPVIDLISENISMANVGSSGVALYNGTKTKITTTLDEFGDAAAYDVASGKTFTSSAGFKAVGTMQPGVDTSDATATANDIASGVTAYGSAGKITGNIKTFKDLETDRVSPTSNLYTSSGNLMARRLFLSNQLYQYGSTIELSISLSDFGNATAADVASGKTFTSSAGLKVTGTASVGDGTKYTIMIYNDTSNDIDVGVYDTTIKRIPYQTLSSGQSYSFSVLNKEPVLVLPNIFLNTVRPGNMSYVYMQNIDQKAVIVWHTGISGALGYIHIVN